MFSSKTVKHLHLHLQGTAGKVLVLALAAVAAVALLAGCTSGSGTTVVINGGSDKQLETSTAVETLEFDEFTSIEASLDVGDIEFTSGNGYSVVIDRKNYPEFTADVANGKLTIKGPEGSWNVADTSCTVTITVPVSARLTSTDLETDTGSIVVDDIASTALAASTDVGEITVTACGVDSYDLSSDVGDIKLLGVGDLGDASIDASTDLGQVTVGSKSSGNSFTQSGTGTKIKAETDTGAITIN